MNTTITKDGWLFTSNNLSDLLEIVKECQFQFNIESIEALLLKKESFVLLKTIIPTFEQESISDFYLTKHNIIANIINDRSIDLTVKKTDIHFGGGLFRENNSWNLFIPLTL